MHYCHLLAREDQAALLLGTGLQEGCDSLRDLPASLDGRLDGVGEIRVLTAEHAQVDQREVARRPRA